MEEMAKKRVKDSETEQSYLLMHRHINGYGRLLSLIHISEPTRPY